MNIPESIGTEIGIYNYPATSISDYVELLSNREVVSKTISDLQLDVDAEQFIKSLSISNEKDSNVVTISFKGQNVETIPEVLDSHISNFETYIELRLKEEAINKFIKTYNVDYQLNEQKYEQIQKTIQEYENLLSELEPVVSLRTALSSDVGLDAKFANSRGVSLQELSEGMLYEEVLNENYVTIEKKITDNKITATELSIKKENFESVLNELESEKALLESGEKSDFLSILITFVNKISPATEPLHSVSTGRGINVILGFVSSLILGIALALFKAYWKNEWRINFLLRKWSNKS